MERENGRVRNVRNIALPSGIAHAGDFADNQQQPQNGVEHRLLPILLFSLVSAHKKSQLYIAILSLVASMCILPLQKQ
jgi:hypothetical protein